MEWIFSLIQLKEVAIAFWESAGPASVIAFHGEMGAGKTTFIHTLCEIKGVQGAVGSPTFSIINEYNYTESGQEKSLYHMDLYRLKDEEEALGAGVEDALYSGHICFVEWPEKAPGIFPDSTLHVWLELVDGQRRKLRIGRN